MTPPLLTQARYHLGSLRGATQGAEDLVQEVWAVAILRLGDLQPQQGRTTPVLLSFLVRTMRNKALNWMRRSASALRAGFDGRVSVDTSTLTADTVGVIRSVVTAEHKDLLAAAMAALEPEDREILVLRGLEENSYEGLATLLGVDAGALRMRYLRARQRLRELLPDSIFEELGER